MLTFPQARMLRRFCESGPYKMFEVARLDGTSRRVVQRLVDKGLLVDYIDQTPNAEMGATKLGRETNAELRRWDNPDDAPAWTEETFDRATAGSPSQTKPPT